MKPQPSRVYLIAVLLLWCGACASPTQPAAPPPVAAPVIAEGAPLPVSHRAVDAGCFACHVVIPAPKPVEPPVVPPAVVPPPPVEPPPVVTPPPVVVPPPPPVIPPVAPQPVSNPQPCTLALEAVSLAKRGPNAVLAFTLKAGYVDVTISLVTYVNIDTSPTGASGPPFSFVTETRSVAGPQQMQIEIPAGRPTFPAGPFQLVEARCGDRMSRPEFASTVFDMYPRP